MTTREKREHSNASQEEDRCPGQGAAPGRCGHPRTARRYGPRPARREHHGVLQGLQRPDRSHARQRHPRRDHDLRGPFVHVHHQDPPGRRADQEGRRRRQGLGCPAEGQGRQADQGPGARDRHHQAAGPERQRHRGRDEDRRGHGPLDGHHDRLNVTVAEPRWLTSTTTFRRNRGKDMQRSKTYRATAETFDRDELHAPLAAIKIAKGGAKKKFDETVDVAMRLGVDPRKADQMVRGTVNLPHGTGKTARVLVFANGDKADAAREAGADVVGGDELIEKVNGGWLDFDAVVATPDMMGKVGRLGRVLGPRGLMPNPKTGTVTPDVTKAVSDIKGGKIEFRVDRHANLHFIIGKASFSQAQLAENYAAALEEVLRLKPASSKGRYLKKVTVSTTMGPGVQVDPNRIKNVAAEDEA